MTANVEDSTESTSPDAPAQKGPTLQEFRDLMEPPTSFEEGFTWAGMIGTLFIALIMVPGAIYMQLVSGFNVSGAARWVMPLLFLEIARRIDQSATVEGTTLVVKLRHLDRETPQLVDALVAAGARVLEVRPEMPALEDVYLHLVGGHQ